MNRADSVCNINPIQNKSRTRGHVGLDVSKAHRVTQCDATLAWIARYDTI